MTTPESWTDRQVLLAGDLSPGQIRAQTRHGQLHRLRPGRYTDGSNWRASDAVQQHRIRALELGHWLGQRAAISHESAAVLHGIQMPHTVLARVHATWPASTGRSSTANVRPHRSQLDGPDVAWLEGIQVTSPARTVFDVARSAPWWRAVPVADSALQLRLCSVADLAAVLASNTRTPGAFRARRVIEFADGKAESVGESICRLQFARIGLPVPNLQAVVPGLGPGHQARVDFDFPEHSTVSEFDGMIKYGRLLDPGQTAGDVVVAEKIREDRLRDTGRQCVRVIWADSRQSEAVLARFRAAFRRSGFPDWKPLPGRFRDT
ncbi:hypothetical protein [Nakamurella sp. PAMC28650]|uniref:hypothetical protein n=1 Tax=Nakamurella sp. PAMC28650 TaxID=2762325 RepID=UPI00164CF258|nr:hypothetical protein [Nakamurella sp. PAMC28650]QNK80880.1 hypothetical protein H7F38_22735 [Nakamurella sp. PAMC28650]